MLLPETKLAGIQHWFQVILLLILASRITYAPE